MMTCLKDKLAVVTGASSGIGRAIAEGLAAHGTSLCLIGRNLQTLAAAAATCSPPSVCKTYKADLASEEEILRTAGSIRADFGRIDILIHSAGYFSMGEIRQASVNELDSHYKINLRAPYILTQALMPVIRPQGGQIVFINSSVGLKARAKVSQYSASKHALKAIADSLREEVNSDGIRVLTIYPGRTATPMQESVHKMEGKTYLPEQFMRAEDVAVVVVNALALSQSAEVTDIQIRPAQKF
jgi:short-subunit dehydrogenase